MSKMSVKVNKVRVSQKSKAKLKNYCKWCGKPFKKYHNRQIYCCDDCKKYARQIQQRDDKRKSRKINYIFKDDAYYGLGSGGLSAHANKNFNNESMKIQKEKKRLGINNLFF